MEVADFHFQSSVNNSREGMDLVMDGLAQLWDHVGVLSMAKLDQAILLGRLRVLNSFLFMIIFICYIVLFNVGVGSWESDPRSCLHSVISPVF